MIYALVQTVCDNKSWQVKDDLNVIVKHIYDILEKVIHPNYRPGLDYEDTRYYVEVEYINKEKTEELEKQGMDFKRENWRA